MLRNRHAADRARFSIAGSVLHRMLGAMLAVGLALSLTTNTAVAEFPAVEFDIPAQPVSSALRAYAQQAKVQLLVLTEGLGEVQANAVTGRLDPQTALEVLLAGTGLQAEYRSDATVTVQRISGLSSESVGVTKNESVSHWLAQMPAASSRGDADIGTPRTRQSLMQANSAERRSPSAAIEEIVVTGSNIRGVGAVGADVTTIDREYIEQSGIATTTELIQSVPQNFGLGANEGVQAVGITPDTTNVNWGFSSSVNLRGLGNSSTLLLLNGRRSAGGGGGANFVDLNTIPIAVIERIEVLPDGASAIYGSDAVGGVVNVILRDDYEGAETTIRYAPGTSDIEEVQFSQVFGKKWDTGNVLFTLEYYDRSELKSEDRDYTRNSDLRPLGGGNHSSDGSNPGNIISPVTFAPAFAIPTGQDGTDLTPADLIDLSTNPEAINLQNIREGSYVLPKQERHSAFVSATQEIANGIVLFAEARFSSREFEQFTRAFETNFIFMPNTNPFFVDAFGDGSPYFVNYNFAEDYGAPRESGEVRAIGGVLGANFLLRGSWDLEVYASYSTEDTFQRVDRLVNTALLATALADPDPTTAINLYGDGPNANPAAIAAIEGFREVNVESELSTVNAVVEGHLFDVPGGAARLAFGGQFRNGALASSTTSFLAEATPSPGFGPFQFDLDRDISAAFAEIYLPLVSAENARSGIRDLAVSIAGRYEDYSDFGDSFDPKLGLAWSPIESLRIRGTVGTSFRAPLLTELNTANNRILLRDIPSPTGSAATLIQLGNSPTMKAQEGETWTAGFDFQPGSPSGFNLGLTYFSTEVDNVIQRPTAFVSRILLDPIANAPVITVCPCDAEAAALMSDPTFQDTPIPPDQVQAIVNGHVQNIAKVELSGVDLNIAYPLNTEIGAFKLSLLASHLFEFKEQLVAGPLVDNVDTIAHPNSLKLRSAVSWDVEGMNVLLRANHIGDYTNDLGSLNCTVTPCRVGSWTTWDVQVRYDFSDRVAGFLNGTQLSLSLQNALDEDPPFVEIGSEGVGFDVINANPMGRFLALQLTKSW